MLDGHFGGGKQHKLAEGRENKKLAKKKFHELSLLVAEAPESSEVRVASLCDAYLQWSERHQSPETYRGYAFYLQKFSEFCGFLRVEDLRPYHVTQWIDGEKKWGVTTQFNAVRDVHRVFNWAVQQQLLPKSPIQGMPRLKPKSRKTYASEEEYRALRRAAATPFKLVLLALRQTGARPGEVRNLKWDQVHDDRWILTEHKTAAKTDKPRVNHLSRLMQRIMQILRRSSQSKFVFVNCHGKPWTTNAIRLQMERLCKKLGLRNICAYELRHAFATHAILNGVGIATVAELMGHRDTTMVSRVYGHLAPQTDYLAAAVRKPPESQPTVKRNALSATENRTPRPTAVDDGSACPNTTPSPLKWRIVPKTANINKGSFIRPPRWSPGGFLLPPRRAEGGHDLVF